MNTHNPLPYALALALAIIAACYLVRGIAYHPLTYGLALALAASLVVMILHYGRRDEDL